MIVSNASINCDNISDWPSFHEEFAKAFGFPDFYGRNMDAWIDCMTSLDSPDDAMTSIHCAKDRVMTLQLENLDSFQKRCPEQYAAIIEGAAFVNWCRMEAGGLAVLALSFRR